MTESMTKQRFFIEGKHIIPFSGVHTVELNDAPSASTDFWMGGAYTVTFGPNNTAVVLTNADNLHNYLMWLTDFTGGKKKPKDKSPIEQLDDLLKFADIN